MRVIGLAGFSKSGKTCVADYIVAWCKKHGVRCTKMSFSKTLAKTKKDNGITKRETINEEMLNDLIDIHIKEREHYARLCEREDEKSFKEHIIVIDDIKYLQDIEMLDKTNAMLVFVDASQRLTMAKSKSQDHLASSVVSGKYSLKIFSKLLDNNGTKKQLLNLLSYATPNLIYGD